jgi:DNA polymerase-4
MPAVANTLGSMTRAIAHIDMDAFYASVEQRDRPELRGRPVIVGADPRGRGVVSAASYEARAFGVRSAMPISRAARLCPHAAFVRPDMRKYSAVSGEIMAILGDFSPLVEPVSIDEAFVDLTGTEKLFGPPASTVQAIKARIAEETRLPVSAGLAVNKFVAKVASDLRKPDGLVVVAPDTEAAFLAPLPVDRLWGVGKTTASTLASLGIATIGQLQAMPRALLIARLGPHADGLQELAYGRDARPVTPWSATKSMGAETTFGRNLTDRARLERTLRGQAERVAAELRAEGVAAARVTLKLRFSDFRTITRSHTADPTQDGLELWRRATALLARERLDQPVRLVGVSASSLRTEASGQLDLLDPNAIRRERLGRVVDRVTRRFGAGALVPATLLPPGGPESEA